jgi:hypothetical protein
MPGRDGLRRVFLNDWQKGTLLIGWCRVPSRREFCVAQKAVKLVLCRLKTNEIHVISRDLTSYTSICE